MEQPRPALRRSLANVALLLLAACTSASAAPAPAPAARSGPTPKVAERVYQGALSQGWQDWGWAPRKLGSGPADLDFARHGGWIVAHPGLQGRYGGLTFRYRAPASYGDFLEVRLDDGTNSLPVVLVGPAHRAALPDGWQEVWISADELNPEELPFDRVVLHARERVSGEHVLVDELGLTAVDPAKPKRAPPPPRAAAMRVDCRAPGRPIKATIYGIAYDNGRDAKQPPWDLCPGARRFGGNTASRYNPELGAWNTGRDWFYRNVGAEGRKPHQAFLEDDLQRGVPSALTLPLLGWVAKDTNSCSFPVSKFGAQQQTDPWGKDSGNGLGRDGSKLLPGPPGRTSVAFAPADVGRYVAALRTADQARGRRSVQLYFLDNEPMLWHDTHRDVHPEPLGYDELLERTLSYGAAVRSADPEAVIAGPAEWGWPAYFYSAKDAAAGFHFAPDRRAHGNQPLLPWYLSQVRAYEKRTGTRILDVLDVHFYPQAEGVGVGKDGNTDRGTNARRLRSTRGLWDPSYLDESWIKEAVRLVPRMREWVDQSAPGLGISIGEWSFGAEGHMSGGLAVAEALGRFGQQGVDYAFYWTYPDPGSPAAWAFRAYRNFDGRGGRFLDRSVPAEAAEGTSLFVSRDETGGHVVAVALNLDPDKAADASIDLGSCGALAGKAYVYAGGPGGFGPAQPVAAEGGVLRVALPAYSITVLDLARR